MRLNKNTTQLHTFYYFTTLWYAFHPNNAQRGHRTHTILSYLITVNHTFKCRFFRSKSHSTILSIFRSTHSHTSASSVGISSGATYAPKVNMKYIHAHTKIIITASTNQLFTYSPLGCRRLITAIITTVTTITLIFIYCVTSIQQQLIAGHIYSIF